MTSFFSISETKVCLCIGSNGPFDYISVTPPYTQVDYGTLMAQISKSAIVGEDTFIVSGNLLLFREWVYMSTIPLVFSNFILPWSR